MPNEEEADAALSSLHHAELEGRLIVLVKQGYKETNQNPVRYGHKGFAEGGS